jgi:DNA-binding phage protein
MPTTKSYHAFLVSSLQDPEESAAYLDSVLEDGDPQHIRLALKNIAEAHASLTEPPNSVKWQECYELLEQDEIPNLLMFLAILNDVT